jgi:hypothetical protein
MKILQTRRFKQVVKKLNPNQKGDLDNAVRELMNNPLLGEQKKREI